MSPVERSLHVVFNKLESICARHRIPASVQYQAKWLFKQSYELNLDKHSQGQRREGMKGTKRDGLIAACTHEAFKSVGLYCTKTRVAEVFGIELGELRRGLAIFKELFKDTAIALGKVTGCKQYIHWFAPGLGLSRGVGTLCCKLFKELSDLGNSEPPF